MDATATPRGISLAVGELGAHGRPTFYMTSRTAVSVNRIFRVSVRSSIVFMDVCPRDTHTPSTHPTHKLSRTRTIELAGTATGVRSD